MSFFAYSLFLDKNEVLPHPGMNLSSLPSQAIGDDGSVLFAPSSSSSSSSNADKGVAIGIGIGIGIGVGVGEGSRESTSKIVIPPPKGDLYGLGYSPTLLGSFGNEDGYYENKHSLIENYEEERYSERGRYSVKNILPGQKTSSMSSSLALSNSTYSGFAYNDDDDDDVYENDRPKSNYLISNYSSSDQRTRRNSDQLLIEDVHSKRYCKHIIYYL
jgi:hypothetical protein